MMEFEKFVERLHACGWKDTGDAQHFYIEELWREIFPDAALKMDRDPIAQLMVFYNVEGKDDLIGAQEKHIKSLQEQLPKDNQRIETRVRG